MNYQQNINLIGPPAVLLLKTKCGDRRRLSLIYADIMLKFKKIAFGDDLRRFSPPPAALFREAKQQGTDHFLAKDSLVPAALLRYAKQQGIGKFYLCPSGYTFLCSKKTFSDKIKKKILYFKILEKSAFTPLEKTINRVNTQNKRITNGCLISSSAPSVRDNSLTGFIRVPKINLVKLIVFISIIIPLLFSRFPLEAEEITIIAAGDIMVSRFIGKDSARKGYNHPYEKISQLLSSADITFGNLECPVSEKGEPTHNGYLFRADPATVKGLVFAGFDVLSLANNHTMDYGADALLDTIKILENNKIYAVGAGKNLTEATKPIIFRKKEVSVGFLAYSCIYEENFCADDKKPGIAPGWLSLVTRDIKKLKKEANITVVSFHWGKEYALKPTDLQIKMAYEAIDAGADLVIGHHPHVLQEIEFYQDKPIIYSLGNLVFDQAFGDTPKSAVLKCTFSHNGLKRIELIPLIRTYDKYYPQIAEGENKQAIISQILGLTEAKQ